MRAHTSKVVKARFAKKNVQMLVVPGGLTLYVQAGDIGIYKSFKDKLSSIIDEWKLSDRVEYTKGAVPDDVINRSVHTAGFSPLKWLSRDESSEDEEVTEDLLENLDEFTIWESEASE
ncbi:hypothetical protein PC120_g26713 [Phytophthora cactorum]|nr:hypothetical protein PC120_g26713 [Phytophthora cactorum]